VNEPRETPREGDQQMPVPNDGTPIQRLVIADMEARLQVGIERYGTPLQAHNGRDALQDAYEEGLDLVMYLRQMIEERKIPGVKSPVSADPVSQRWNAKVDIYNQTKEI
jgi:hypothetical protein